MTITDAMAFLVVVDARRTAMPWGRYPTQDSAEQSARKLRCLGMSARVVRVDGTTAKQTKREAQ